MIKFALLLAVTLVIQGCQIKGEPTAEYKNVTMLCLDSRDGEKFSFHTSSITNVKIGIGAAESSFEATDQNGNKRFFTKSQDIFVKCVKAK